MKLKKFWIGLIIFIIGFSAIILVIHIQILEERKTKAYIYEIFHRCETITDWIPSDCTLALSSTQKIEGKYSIKMTADDNKASTMRYDKNVDWSEFHDIIFSVYHPGYTNEIGWIGLYTDLANYKIWEFDFAASWTERIIDLSSEPLSSDGTLDLSNIDFIIVFQRSLTFPGEDYYFDFFHGRSIDISADIIHPLSFIGCPIRDYHKAEIIAKGTWIPSKDYTIEILDYYTSNGSSTADQIIFEGSIIDYELTNPRKIWCDSRAKRDLDEFRPSGDYNDDLDSNHIKTLIAECSDITEGTIDATVGNTNNTFKGDKTFRTILNDWADKHYKHWYLSPTRALSFNDADVDSGVILFHHKATYNFKDEIVGTSGTSISFVDAVEDSSLTTIISDFDNHRKILQNYANAKDNYFDHNITQATSGTRELYIASNEVTNWALTWIFFEDATSIIIIQITGGNLRYEDSVAGWTVIQAISINTLYHIRLDWKADDTFDMWVNGTQRVTGGNTSNAQISGIDGVRWDTANGYKTYIDAWGDPDNDTNYTIGDNLKGELFHCWNVKPKKHVDAINWVKLLGAIVAGTQIFAESKDQNSIDELGAKIYKDTYALTKLVAQLQIAADNLRTREQLLPLAIDLWSYEVNRGLIQVGECVWFAHDKGNPNISPRQVIINKIVYRFLSGHTELQTTDGIAFIKDKDAALPQENSLLIQQNVEQTYTQAEVDALISDIDLTAEMGIGIANKRWINCIYEGSNIPSDVSVGAFFANAGANDYNMIFAIPLDYVIGTHNLVITRIKIGIQIADASDYLDRVRLFGMSDELTQNTLVDNETNRTARGIYTYDHADQIIGGAQERALLYLDIYSSVANEFRLTFVKVEYYYTE